MEKEQIISSGLLELYATGAASEAEILTVETALASFPELRAVLTALEETLEAYAFSGAVYPSQKVKEFLLEKIFPVNADSGRAVAKVISISPVWRAIAAGAVLLLLGSAVMNILFYNKYQAADAGYKTADANFRESQQQIALQTEKLNGMSQDMDVVQSKYSEPVALHGLTAAPDAAAKIFWMKNTGDVYIDPSNLPAAPSGMQYQLWAIVDGKPIDGGMVQTENGKYHIQKMKTFGKAQAFAVTLETRGGNPEPKGKMYVMGEI